MSDQEKRRLDESRRSLVKKAAYIAPAILTLKAVPSFASYGSGATTSKTNNGGGVNNNHTKKSKSKKPKENNAGGKQNPGGKG